MPESADITWSVRIDGAIDRVYHFLATDEGRAQFWAESAVESDGKVTFKFPSGETYEGKIISDDPPERFVIDYFGSPVSFLLQEDESEGTILTMTHHDVDEDIRCETMAGWVSVLLALKAVINFSVDLRNHDPVYTWNEGYVGN